MTKFKPEKEGGKMPGENTLYDFCQRTGFKGTPRQVTAKEWQKMVGDNKIARHTTGSQNAGANFSLTVTCGLLKGHKPEVVFVQI